ncbi:hypothetical protein C8F01DRAFT_1311940 [Mycena amicta]|nr:hypothetical protein C8F01DRAFT_1311940 [Mycena amicta]
MYSLLSNSSTEIGSSLVESQALDLEKLYRLAKDARLTSIITVGFFALLIYEHLLTLDKEISLVWKNPKPSIAKYIFIWNRYFSFLVMGVCTSVYIQQVNSDVLCTLYSRIRYLSSTIIVLTVDVILMLRVWILFNQSRKLLYFMIPAILGEAAVMLLIGEATVQDLTVNVFSPLFNGCYSSKPLPWYFPIFAVPSLVVGLVMFVLTIYHCTASSKLDLSFGSIVDVRGSWMPIASLFLRDGVFWFCAVIAVNPVQIVLWLVEPVTLGEVLMVPSTIVYSIIGSRSLINLLDITNVEIANRPIVPKSLISSNSSSRQTSEAYSTDSPIVWRPYPATPTTYDPPTFMTYPPLPANRWDSERPDYV